MFETPYSWKVLLAEGIIFLVLGVLALIYPYVVAISLEVVIGTLLIIAGIVQTVRAIIHFRDPRSLILLIGAAFAVLAGIILLKFPLTGVMTLTLILSAFFLIDGITKTVNGLQLRPLKGSGWLIFAGLFSIVLAILIVSGLPTSAVWVIGIFFGVYMIFLGMSLLVLSHYVKEQIGKA